MLRPLLLTLGLAAGPALADVPNVATDILPVHSLAARVMAGVGAPALIVPPGTSPHAYALRPSEANALEQADLVFWIGEALTPWMERPLDTLAGDAQVIELLHAPDTLTMAFREGASFEAHDHDDEAQAEADHHDHDDHGDIDPHVWLDPENGKAWLDLMAGALAQADPENAAAYRANAAAGKAEIDAVTADINALLTPVHTTPFVVFHDAYHYFERRFDLSAAGAISLGDASDPSPARIAEIRHIVQDLNADCVFSEPQFNAGLVDTVFEGTSAKTGVLDPLGTLIPSGPRHYVETLDTLGHSIAACLK